MRSDRNKAPKRNCGAGRARFAVAKERAGKRKGQEAPFFLSLSSSLSHSARHRLAKLQISYKKPKTIIVSPTLFVTTKPRAAACLVRGLSLFFFITLIQGRVSNVKKSLHSNIPHGEMETQLLAVSSYLRPLTSRNSYGT